MVVKEIIVSKPTRDVCSIKCSMLSVVRQPGQRGGLNSDPSHAKHWPMPICPAMGWITIIIIYIIIKNI